MGKVVPYIIGGRASHKRAIFRSRLRGVTYRGKSSAIR